jgi:acyl carrier protein
MSPTTAPLDSTIDLDQALRTLLTRIAPEADLAALEARADIRATLELDSFDFLQFVVAINESLGVAIPEADYGKIRTLEGCRRYLEAQRTAR